jgi:hypothetical protein
MRKRVWLTVLGLWVGLGTSGFATDNFQRGQDLTGTWRIQVTIPAGSSACAGPEACTFLAMATATSDGTIMQTAALPGVSTGHGVWQRVGLRSFRVRTTYFRVGPHGLPLGTAETTTTVTISADGRSASGSYENVLLDFGGNALGGFSASVTGTRLLP